MASSARKSAAIAIKKIHVPAYWPCDIGVQFIENSGVVEEKKNVIAMVSMPIIEEEDIGIAELVELAMSMADMVLVGDIDIDIDLPAMVLEGAIDMDIKSVELIVDMSIAACSMTWDEDNNRARF